MMITLLFLTLSCLSYCLISLSHTHTRS